MAYSEDARVTARLRASPSLVFHNLAIQGDRVLYAHMDQVWAVEVASLMRGGEETNVDSKGRKIATAQEICQMQADQAGRVVNHICPIVLSSGSFIALATTLGVQVFDGSGKALKLFWPLPEKDAPDRAVEHASTSCCWVRAASGDVCLCVGSSSGRIYVFGLDEGGARMPHIATLVDQMGSSITALGSHLQSRGGRPSPEDPAMLLSGDDSGRVIMYSVPDTRSFTKCGELSGRTICVGLAARGDLAVVGSIDGVVKVYSLSALGLRAEVVAHSRLMSALALHPTRDVVLSCGEDATVCAWTLPTPGNDAVRMLLQAVWQNSLLTGACFAGDNVVVVPYDHEEAAVYKVTGTL